MGAAVVGVISWKGKDVSDLRGHGLGLRVKVKVLLNSYTVNISRE